MTVEEDFDRAAADLKNAVDRAERSISEAAPNQRPTMERQLAEVLASDEHLQPLGARSRDLSDIASNNGIYSAQNVEAINTGLANGARSRWRGTGIRAYQLGRLNITGSLIGLNERRLAEERSAP